MATARLRVFPRPEDEVADERETPSLPVRLIELYPLLAQAFRDNYVWLRDFEDDEVLVSPDLYEVVRTFLIAALPRKAGFGLVSSGSSAYSEIQRCIGPPTGLPLLGIASQV